MSSESSCSSSNDGSFIIVQKASPNARNISEDDCRLSEREQDYESKRSETVEMCSSDATTTTTTTTTTRAGPLPLQRHGLVCQLCEEEVRGDRWICLNCYDYSLCNSCLENVSLDQVHPKHTFIRARHPKDIYQATQLKPAETTPLVHMHVLCSSCQCPILDIRYECIADTCLVNLCQACESHPLSFHPPSHAMIKYRVAKENIATSSMLDHHNEYNLEQRAAFERINQPLQISNKGYWHLPENIVITPAVLEARNRLQMAIKKDKEMAWGSCVQSGSLFARSWDITNNGQLPWPKGTSLLRISPAIFSPPFFRKRIVSDDVVLAGSTISVRFVDFKAPVIPGTYLEVWALCDNQNELFGERLEIRLYVGNRDEFSSDRYFGLEEVLQGVTEGKEDVTREIDGKMKLSETKMMITSSVIEWCNGKQTIGCMWEVRNVGNSDFPLGLQLQRRNRTVGASLEIDDSEASISVPQWLPPFATGTIRLSNLKVQTVGTNRINSKDSQRRDGSIWFSDSWVLVDSRGTVLGDPLYFAQSFDSIKVESGKGGKRHKKQTLRPHRAR